MSTGPGSETGLQEARHWAFENGAIKKAEKEFMRAEIERRFAGDPRKRRELLTWLNARTTTTAKARRVCKLWGVELPRN
jgi:hypothetical protein